MKSISNAEIKSVKSLSAKKFRDETGLFVVEGEKMVEEALRSPFEVVKVYRREEVGEDVMARLSSLSTPSPVLAVLRQRTVAHAGGSQPFVPSDGCSSRKPDVAIPANGRVSPDRSAPAGGHGVSAGLYLALDSIRDPGNLGTILRIADWFGIRAVVASPDTVEVYNPKVVQSTMGAIFRVDFQYVDLEMFAQAVLSAGGSVYGTFLDGTDIYGQQLKTGADSPVAIVIGNESNGISPRIARLVSDRLFIPPYPADDPGSESLNAAVATAITVAEFRRRLH